MKILISSDGMHAHYYQRLAWLKAFRSCGFEASFWDCKNTSAFDAFDRFEPDVFLGQLYNLDDSLIKCIYERPHLKVGLRAGDWGEHNKKIDPFKFNILSTSHKEIDIIKKLKDETGKPDFVHIHYDSEAMEETHDRFSSIGVNTLSLMMCADIEEYLFSSHDESLECDIGFVGGYWPYKGQIIDKYLLPLCHPVGKYNIKIFGNQPWHGVNQYCGMLADSKVANLFKSSAICPNLSEPHAHEYGFDVNERVFKVLCAGGFCISDNVKSLKNIFDNSGVVFADSPEEFRDRVDYYLVHPEEREEISTIGKQTVLNNHTNFHRAATILEAFGYSGDAENVLTAWDKTRSNLNV
jgi:spore maturation protein CgeB